MHCSEKQTLVAPQFFLITFMSTVPLKIVYYASGKQFHHWSKSVVAGVERGLCSPFTQIPNTNNSGGVVVKIPPYSTIPIYH